MRRPIRFTCPDCDNVLRTLAEGTPAACPSCSLLQDAPYHTDDCPPVDHVHAAWTDDDTAELASAMRDAAWTTGTRHALARLGRTSPSPAADRAERAIDNLCDDHSRSYPLVAQLIADHRAGRAY